MCSNVIENEEVIDEKTKLLNQIRYANTVSVFYKKKGKKGDTKIQIFKDYISSGDKYALANIIDSLWFINCNLIIDKHENNTGSKSHLCDLWLSKKKRMSIWTK